VNLYRPTIAKLPEVVELIAREVSRFREIPTPRHIYVDAQAEKAPLHGSSLGGL
jgi:hypothetical protein